MEREGGSHHGGPPARMTIVQRGEALCLSTCVGHFLLYI